MNFVIFVSCLAAVTVATPVKDIQSNPKCGSQSDIFDSEGNYVKTACMLFAESSHEKACKESNMNLFVVDSDASKDQLLRFATSAFGSGGGSTLWINGKRETDGNWYTYDPSEKLMWNKLVAMVDESEESDESNLETRIAEAVEERCMMISAFGAFKIDSRDCYPKMYPVCEYRKTGDVPKMTTTRSKTPPQMNFDDSDKHSDDFSDSYEEDRDEYTDEYLYWPVRTSPKTTTTVRPRRTYEDSDENDSIDEFNYVRSNEDENYENLISSTTVSKTSSIQSQKIEEIRKENDLDSFENDY